MLKKKYKVNHRLCRIVHTLVSLCVRKSYNSSYYRARHRDISNHKSSRHPWFPMFQQTLCYNSVQRDEESKRQWITVALAAIKIQSWRILFRTRSCKSQTVSKLSTNERKRTKGTKWQRRAFSSVNISISCKTSRSIRRGVQFQQTSGPQFP